MLCLIFATCLDYLIGEPKKYHPLVLFGAWVNAIETFFFQSQHNPMNRLKGFYAVTVALLPGLLLIFLFNVVTFIYPSSDFVLSIGIVYLCIGLKSLKQHAHAIIVPLRLNPVDIIKARKALSYIVSRDTANLTEEQICKAATESVLENGADAFFCAIFWFLVAGAPGIIIYRMVNTLDAMWGYKHTRYIHFGYTAAKLDDAMNWLPARFTALSYALCGDTRTALRCWYTQAKLWKSPNAGPVMASGAGAIQVKLGGESYYKGVIEIRPLLGADNTASVESIDSALLLINKALVLWFIILLVLFGL